MNHIISNFAIASAYAVIPLFFIKYWSRIAPNARPIIFLYGAFILSCGIGHALSGLEVAWVYYWHYLTAIISWTAAIATGYLVPKLIEQLEILSEIMIHAPVGIGIYKECQNTSGNRDLRWLACSDRAIEDININPIGKILGEVLPNHNDGLLQDYLDVLDRNTRLEREIEYQDSQTGKIKYYSQIVLSLPSGLLLICWQDITRLKTLIAEQQRLTQKLEEQLICDPLTGAYNRTYYDRFVASKQPWSGLLYCDIDYFKSINDTLGHKTGDDLLRQVCDRIINCASCGTLIRIGGDEFVVLFPLPVSYETIVQLARLILQEIEKPFELKNREVHITASIGVVPALAGDLEMMLVAGDATMYLGKKDRLRDRLIIWDRDSSEDIKKAETINLYIKKVIRDDFSEFSLVYQPIVDLQNPNYIAGAEALIRWHNQELGQISPNDFIPIAEDSGQICKISNWVLKEAIAQLALWQNFLNIAINISPWDLEQKGFLESIINYCYEYQVDASRLGLEITERVVSSNTHRYLGVMQHLMGLNIKPKIDDFGTGYSGLKALLEVKWNAVKIDRSLIPTDDRDISRIAIARTVISMCKELGITTVAEGIETEEQRDLLLKLGCEQGQGYLFARPMSADGFEAYLALRQSTDCE